LTYICAIKIHQKKDKTKKNNQMTLQEQKIKSEQERQAILKSRLEELTSCGTKTTIAYKIIADENGIHPTTVRAILYRYGMYGKVKKRTKAEQLTQGYE
jgi:hypothetical protein